MIMRTLKVIDTEYYRHVYINRPTYLSGRPHLLFVCVCVSALGPNVGEFIVAKGIQLFSFDVRTEDERS